MYIAYYPSFELDQKESSLLCAQMATEVISTEASEVTDSLKWYLV